VQRRRPPRSSLAGAAVSECASKHPSRHVSSSSHEEIDYRGDSKNTGASPSRCVRSRFLSRTGRAKRRCMRRALSALMSARSLAARAALPAGAASSRGAAASVRRLSAYSARAPPPPGGGRFGATWQPPARPAVAAQQQGLAPMDEYGDVGTSPHVPPLEVVPWTKEQKNSVNLIGNVGSMDVRQLSSGKTKATIGLAVDAGIPPGQTERVTEWCGGESSLSVPHGPVATVCAPPTRPRTHTHVCGNSRPRAPRVLSRVPHAPAACAGTMWRCGMGWRSRWPSTRPRAPSWPSPAGLSRPSAAALLSERVRPTRACH
jgi:hypothetical protein